MQDLRPCGTKVPNLAIDAEVLYLRLVLPAFYFFFNELFFAYSKTIRNKNTHAKPGAQKTPVFYDFFNGP